MPLSTHPPVLTGSSCVIHILILAAISLAGYAVLALFDRQRALDEPERCALGFPVGIGAVGAMLYTANVLGVPFDARLVLAVGGGAALCGAGVMAARWRSVSAMLGRVRAIRCQPDVMAMVALLVVCLISAGFVARAYYFVNWQPDTELYHFPFAGYIFRTHHQPTFASQSYNEEFSFPSALFNVYAAIWTARGHVDQLLPNLFPIPLFLSWIWLSWLACTRVLRRGVGAVAFASLLFVATYEIDYMLCGEGTDFLPVVLGGAAAYLLARDRDQGGWRRLPTTILVAGLIGWTKYHGIPFAGCLAAALFLSVRLDDRRFGLWGGRARSWTALWPATILFLGAALLTAPMLIRNAIVWHNPIYPVGCQWLGGSLSTHWTNTVVAGWVQGRQPFNNFPVPLCLGLREPALLLGMPCLLLALKRRESGATTLGLVALLYFIAFVALLAGHTPYPLRFAGPALGIFAWMGGALLEDLRTRVDGVALRMTAAWVVTCGIVLGAYSFTPLATSYLPPSPDGPVVDALVRFWWVLALGLVMAALARSECSEPVRSSAGSLALAAVILIAVVHHQPFMQVLDASRLGLLTRPDWSRPSHTSPMVNWMQMRLGPKSVIYTYFDRRWSLPGASMPADDPHFESIHRPGATLDEAVECLRRMGVTHVLAWDTGGQQERYEAYRTDLIFKRLDDPRYFHLVRKVLNMTLYEVTYPGRYPEKPSPGHTMPWLMGFAATGVVPPRNDGRGVSSQRKHAPAHEHG